MQLLLLVLWEMQGDWFLWSSLSFLRLSSWADIEWVPILALCIQKFLVIGDITVWGGMKAPRFKLVTHRSHEIPPDIQAAMMYGKINLSTDLVFIITFSGLFGPFNPQQVFHLPTYRILQRAFTFCPTDLFSLAMSPMPYSSALDAEWTPGMGPR